jgi:hypothetical protein
MKSSGEFDAQATRSALKGKVDFDEARILRCPFKPYDIRIAYLDARIAPLFSRPAPQLQDHATIQSNAFFITRDTADKAVEGPPFLYSSLVCDYDCLSGHARHFPIWLCGAPQNPTIHASQMRMFADEQVDPKIIANLARTARAYLASLGTRDPDSDASTAELIWMHALAIGYSPTYLSENADGIRQDWPRIPLPDSKKALLASAKLGRQVAALLDTEKAVTGVTPGSIRPELRRIGVVSRRGGGALDPNAGELDLTAGWGHAGKAGVCMPGQGKVVERKAKPGEVPKALGNKTLDIYLNETAYT